MRNLFIRSISLFLLLFTNTLLAHPHSTAAEAVAHHGILYSLIENGFIILFVMMLGLCVFKLLNRVNGKQSNHK